MSDFTHHPVSLEIGRLYRFKGIVGPKDETGQPTWSYPPSVYRLVCVAHDYRVYCDRVVYVGVSKDHDLDKHYLCGFADWERDFVLLPEGAVP